MNGRFLMVVALGCAACDAIPRDPEGTLERAQREGRFRVGLIASAERDPRVGQFVESVGAAATAVPEVETAAAEPLLQRLEKGELDLVVGKMDGNTPWSKRVFLLPPLAETAARSGKIQLVPMARNGENRWIALLHAEARRQSGQ